MAVFCSSCGNSMNNTARFCSACGSPIAGAGAVPSFTPVQRLIRPRTGRQVAGVCQGLSNSYGWDVTWVRVLTVLISIFGGGAGVVAYVVFWVVMPEEQLALPSVTYVPPVS